MTAIQKYKTCFVSLGVMAVLTTVNAAHAALAVPTEFLHGTATHHQPSTLYLAAHSHQPGHSAHHHSSAKKQMAHHAAGHHKLHLVAPTYQAPLHSRQHHSSGHHHSSTQKQATHSAVSHHKLHLAVPTFHVPAKSTVRVQAHTPAVIQQQKVTKSAHKSRSQTKPSISVQQKRPDVVVVKKSSTAASAPISLATNTSLADLAKKVQTDTNHALGAVDTTSHRAPQQAEKNPLHTPVQAKIGLLAVLQRIRHSGMQTNQYAQSITSNGDTQAEQLLKKAHPGVLLVPPAPLMQASHQTTAKVPSDQAHGAATSTPTNYPHLEIRSLNPAQGSDTQSSNHNMPVLKIESVKPELSHSPEPHLVFEEPQAVKENLSKNKMPTYSSTTNLWPIVATQLRIVDHYKHNPQVRAQIYWLMQHRDVFNRTVHNAIPYLYYVYQQTQRRHMPAEVALLPMVESGYDPYAYSTVGATGLWQIMQGTSMSFGMAINWWYDGRRDTIVSTQAALNYIIDAHHQIGDWTAALASYNCGVGRVQHSEAYNRAIGRPTDYWSLPLPAETRSYIPKLLAFAAIIENPSAYGFQLPFVPDEPYFSAVRLNSQIDLSTAADLANTSVSFIQNLNPGIRRWATDPDGEYTLLVPAVSKNIFIKNMNKQAGKRVVSWTYHQVQKGESIQSVAKNYHTSVALLDRVNALGPSHAFQMNQGIVVPLRLNRTYSAVMDVPGGSYRLENPALPQGNNSMLTGNNSAAAGSQKISSNDSLKTLLSKLYANKSQ